MHDEIPEEFADRYWGLIFFGTLACVLGALCLLMVPLMLLGSVINKMPFTMIIPSVATYLGIGGINLILGIGCILCRRWARRLMLIWSAFWLLGMSVAAIFGGYAVIKLLPSSQLRSMGGAEILFITFIFGTLIVLPSAFFAFFALPSVRWTFVTRDPNPSWTESRPLSILAATLLFASMMITFLCLIGQPFPFFGHFVTGAAELGVVVFLSFCWGAIAWGFWNLRWPALWASLMLIVVITISGVVTFTEANILQLYETMKMPEQSIAMMQKSGLLGTLRWLQLGYLIPFILFIGITARHFRKPS